MCVFVFRQISSWWRTIMSDSVAELLCFRWAVAGPNFDVKIIPFPALTGNVWFPRTNRFDWSNSISAFMSKLIFSLLGQNLFVRMCQIKKNLIHLSSSFCQQEFHLNKPAFGLISLINCCCIYTDVFLLFLLGITNLAVQSWPGLSTLSVPNLLLVVVGFVPSNSSQLFHLCRPFSHQLQYAII